MSQTKVSEQRIPDFITFCYEQKLELPIPPEAMDENQARTCSKEGNYPPQMYWGLYPPGYKTPIAADSAYYQSINKKKK